MELSEMKKVLYCTLLLCGLLSFSSQSLAITKTEVCNGCSYSEMEKKATTAQVKFGASHVVIVDFVNKSSRKFTVVNDEGDRGEPIRYAYESSLSNEERASVASLFEYRGLLVETVKQAEEINKKLYPNYVYAAPQKVSIQYSSTDKADESRLYVGEIKTKGDPYDFLTFSAISNTVFERHIQTNSGILQATANNVLNTISIPKIMDLGVFIDVKFYSDDLGEQPNGVVQVGIDALERGFVPISGKDVNKNDIPMTASQALGGGFSLGGSGNIKEKFERYLSTLIGGSTAGGSGGCSLYVKETIVIDGRYYFIYACK
jgi:hypothetical protein